MSAALHFAGITVPVHAARPAVAPPRPVARPAAAPAPSSEDREGFRAGIRQERARWARVLGSSAFGSAAPVAAHLLAGTDMSASEIIGSLRQITADAKAAPAVREASIADRWAAAFERARAADNADGPRPSHAVAQRWSGAFKRAGVA